MPIDDELLLPINRKEVFYTATVLPAIVGCDNFAHLDLLLHRCGLDVGFAPPEAATDLQFLTEYNFTQAVKTAGEKARFAGKPKGTVTPDVVIRGDEWLVALEAKLYQPQHPAMVEAQLAGQAKLIDYWIKTLKLDPTRVAHRLLIPEPFGASLAGSGLEEVAITWEDVHEDFLPFASPYWLDVLKVALGSYAKRKSPAGSVAAMTPFDGKLTGEGIRKAYLLGYSMFPWIGRTGGL